MLAALLLPTLLTGGAQAPAGAVKLNEPRVQYKADEASATRRPWIDANGWRILRSPETKFVYHVKGEAAAMAAAESYMYGATAFISTDAPVAFGKMLAFLKTIPTEELTPVADFGVVDDGSELAGEALNLLTRMNLLYKIEKSADPNFPVNVRLGTKEYPKEDAQNPSVLANKIRSQIGDDNRALRVYGSEVVVARFLDSKKQGRVFLLNYSGRPVLGLRVRVRGAYFRGELRAFGVPETQVVDWSADGAATEFTVPELGSFAVIDLAR